MSAGEVREISDQYLIEDLTKAGYIEEVKEGKKTKNAPKGEKSEGKN